MAAGPNNLEALVATRRLAKRLYKRLSAAPEVTSVGMERTRPWQDWLPSFDVYHTVRTDAGEAVIRQRVRTIRASNGEAAIITETVQ